MRFDSEYLLEYIDTRGAFIFRDGEDKRIIAFMYEQDLGIPERLHLAATSLFTEIAAESRSEK